MMTETYLLWICVLVPNYLALPSILNLFGNSCVGPKLPNKFTRSPDGIPSAVLRSLSYELCTPLYIIFKASIDSGECPSLWKYADITPVYKKGDASQASNYRPISILPTMCRLFERILADGINYFLYQNSLISAAQ